MHTQLYIIIQFISLFNKRRLRMFVTSRSFLCVSTGGDFCDFYLPSDWRLILLPVCKSKISDRSRREAWCQWLYIATYGNDKANCHAWCRGLYIDTYGNDKANCRECVCIFPHSLQLCACLLVDIVCLVIIIASANLYDCLACHQWHERLSVLWCEHWSVTSPVSTGSVLWCEHWSVTSPVSTGSVLWCEHWSVTSPVNTSLSGDLNTGLSLLLWALVCLLSFEHLLSWDLFAHISVTFCIFWQDTVTPACKLRVTFPHD